MLLLLSPSELKVFLLMLWQIFLGITQKHWLCANACLMKNSYFPEVRTHEICAVLWSLWIAKHTPYHFPSPPSITPFPVSSHRAPETSWKCSEVKRGANTKLLSAGWIQGTAQEQAVQWGCGCPIPAGTQGQAGCGSGQPGLLIGDPAQSRGLGLDEHCGPFQSIVLWYTNPSEIISSSHGLRWYSQQSLQVFYQIKCAQDHFWTWGQSLGAAQSVLPNKQHIKLPGVLCQICWILNLFS